MGRKYLEDIGWQPMDLRPDDLRHEEWKKEREIYGFDETETWNLCDTMYGFIYERLKMFNECNGVNTEFYKLEYKGQILTMQECIDRILKSLELAIKNPVSYKEDIIDATQEAMELLALCHGTLWW